MIKWRLFSLNLDGRLLQSNVELHEATRKARNRTIKKPC